MFFDPVIDIVNIIRFHTKDCPDSGSRVSSPQDPMWQSTKEGLIGKAPMNTSTTIPTNTPMCTPLNTGTGGEVHTHEREHLQGHEHEHEHAHDHFHGGDEDVHDHDHTGDHGPLDHVHPAHETEAHDHAC